MSRKVVLVPALISAVFFAVLLVFLLKGAGPPGAPGLAASNAPEDAGEEVDPTSAPADSQPAVASVTTEDDASEGQATEEELSAAPGAMLHGEVRDPNGRPVPGAQVLVRTSADIFRMEDAERRDMMRDRALGRAQALQPRTVSRTTTDGEGRYAFPIASLARGRYLVVAAASELAPDNEDWTWRRESTRIDFRLEPGRVISGFVVDTDGSPAEGARVVAREEDGGRRFGPGGDEEFVAEAATDADGHFTMHVGEGVFEVQADASGRAGDERDRVASGTTDLELRLGPGRGIAGRIVGPEEEPVGDVAVALYDARGRRGFGRGGWEPSALQRRIFQGALERATTGADGSFRFVDLEPGSYSVVTEPAGFRPQTETVDVEEGTAEVLVRLQPGRVLAGRVLDEDEAPVPGAFVIARRGGGGGRWEGRRLEQLEERREELREEGRLDELQELEERIAREEREQETRPLTLFRSHEAVETDAGGRFRFDTLTAAAYDISVEAEGLVPRRVEGFDLTGGNREGVELFLDEGARIEGQVVTSTDGSPVPEARIRLTRGRDEVRQAKSDADGNFVVSGLVPGQEWTLVADADLHTLSFIDDVGVEPGAAVQELEVRIDPAAVVRGRVVGADGEPVDRAQVRIQEERPEDDERGRGGRGRRQRWQDERRRRARAVEARTDAQGRFVLEDVNPAPALVLRVDHRDYRDFRGEPFSLAPGEELDGLELVLSAGGRLMVDVVDSEGRPVPGLRVELTERAEPEDSSEDDEDGRGRRRGGWRGRGRALARATTDADGRAVFSGLDPGPRAVVTDWREHQPYAAAVDIVEDSAVSHSVRLLPENAISGGIVDQMGAPVPGARVIARSISEDSVTGRRNAEGTRSGEDGRFRIGELGEGPYALQVEARGFAPRSLEEVEVNTETRVVLDRLGSVAGWVLSERGSPLPEFQLMLVRLDEKGEPVVDPGDRGRGFGGRGFGGRGRRGRRGGGDVRRDRVNDPSGAFAVDDLAPGRWMLEASAEGYTPASVRFELDDGEALEGLEIRLPEGLSVLGRVADEQSGQPLEGVGVWLVRRSTPPPEDEDASGGIEARQRRRDAIRRRRRQSDDTERAQQALSLVAQVKDRPEEILTGPDGTFRIPDVAPGRYAVLVHDPAYVPWHGEVVVREEGGPGELSIRLDPGEELSGEVSMGRRDSAAGVTVVLQDALGVEKTTAADGKGRYAFGGLVPGTYQLNVRVGPSALVEGMSVNVREGKNEFDVEIPNE